MKSRTRNTIYTPTEIVELGLLPFKSTKWIIEKVKRGELDATRSGDGRKYGISQQAIDDYNTKNKYTPQLQHLIKNSQLTTPLLRSYLRQLVQMSIFETDEAETVSSFLDIVDRQINETEK